MSWRSIDRHAFRRFRSPFANLRNNMRLKPTTNVNIALIFAASCFTATNFPRLAHAESALKKQQVQILDNDEQNLTSCPTYGCPLFCRDTYFDDEARAALKIIRSLHNSKTKPESNLSKEDKAGEEKKQEGEENSSKHIQQQEDNDLSDALDKMKNTGGKDEATLTLIGYKGGRLQDQINQDRAFVVSPFNFTASERVGSPVIASDESMPSFNQNKFPFPRRMLGVFDGHAEFGELVSEYAVQNLPKLLSSKLDIIFSSEQEISSSSSSTDQYNAVKDALIESFVEIDRTAPADKSGGCTASVVLQVGTKIFLANTGDSRSFIVTYRHSDSSIRIVHATKDHKPHVPEEKSRVEDYGGKVYVPSPQKLASGVSSRVLFIDKKTGNTHGLAMSRSIGDWDAGKLGVIPDPAVDVLDILEILKHDEDDNTCNAEEDKSEIIGEKKESHLSSDVEIFAVSATDGMIDYVEMQDIAEVIAASLYVEDGIHVLSACENLIHKAASGWWKSKEGRYRDDIAIAVSKLKLT